MSFNHLLTWMSARGCGSWAQFRAAVERYHVEFAEHEQDEEIADDVTASDLPIYQVARLNLERLAHVEFFSPRAGADWRVVPPSLAVHKEGDQWVGILCGARPPDLCERIEKKVVIKKTQAARGIPMPDCIRLLASDLAKIESAAKAGELHVQIEAPTSILAAIPPVDDPRSYVPADAPTVPGWSIERFLPSKLRWTAQNHQNEKDLEFGDLVDCQTGLFRCRMRHQRIHYLRWQGRTYRVNVQVGKYAVLRRQRIRNLLKYDSHRSILSVPVNCRPPPLVERGLVLCTGLLPVIDKATGRLEYTVPQEIARLAGWSLRQEINGP
ncbi:MAG: hypothetical protein ISN28_01850 [Ectothiorhodospiraceae bacterium AqS1]|nr:hypothetical protein [Ectothiorhodospiraceae bacterium AqS1]